MARYGQTFKDRAVPVMNAASSAPRKAMAFATSAAVPRRPSGSRATSLAAVLDLHSRQVVGWSLQPHMHTALVKDALLMACFRRQPASGLIFHSSRGSQYCSQDFQDTLKDWGITSSMSRKGNCWDNAPTENLWGH